MPGGTIKEVNLKEKSKNIFRLKRYIFKTSPVTCIKMYLLVIFDDDKWGSFELYLSRNVQRANMDLLLLTFPPSSVRHS